MTNTEYRAFKKIFEDNFYPPRWNGSLPDALHSPTAVLGWYSDAIRERMWFHDAKLHEIASQATEGGPVPDAKRLSEALVGHQPEEYLEGHYGLQFREHLLESFRLSVEEYRRSRKTESTSRAKLDSEAERAPFIHSPDYSSVRLHGELFSLTQQQARIIEYLHRQYLYGTPDVTKDNILLEAESAGSSLRDCFKSNLEAWKKLIASKRRGTYRLNLD